MKERYFKALSQEAKLLARRMNERGVYADSVFIGGGTPSSVDSGYIKDILEILPVTDDAEITIECNPATLSEEKLAGYRSAGINRLSMGVQSFDDGELSFLGRIHSAAEAESSFRMARRCGFDNINLDLIFGLPVQTMESWEKTVEKAISLRPEHISFYSLQIEEGTVLYEMFRRDEVEQLSDEMNRSMYHQALDMLESNGYVHYEISNASLPGRMCRHNLKYWKMLPYNGIGAAAHSFENGWRYFNPGDIDEYIAAVDDKLSTGDLMAGAEADENTPDESITDRIFTGMRLIDGLDLSCFREETGLDLAECKREVIQEAAEQGLLEIRDGKLRFTRSGLDISNRIIRELMP